MKKFIIPSFILSLTILPSFSDSTIVKKNGEEDKKTTSGNGCYNPPTTTTPKPCVAAKEESKNSIIMNGGLRYFTWSDDYKSSSNSSGCAPCGGLQSGSAGASLPELAITRFFEPLSYGREHLTFGNSHGIKTYDQRLHFTAGHTAIDFEDYGERVSKRGLNFNSVLQCWTENSNRYDQGIASLHLFDAAGLPIITSATRNNAHTGVILNYDGSC